MAAGNPVRKDGISVTEIGDQVLLCGVDEEAIHFLNPTARLIWQLCDGRHSIDDIEHSIAERFDVSETTDVRGDIEATLATLVAKGLLLPMT